MWSRINHRTIPISIKLTFLYATILSFILLLISALTVAGLYYLLSTQVDDDIKLSAISINHYLAEGNSLDQSLLKEKLLVPGVILRVFDDQNILIIDSNPYISDNRVSINEVESNLNPLRFVRLKNKALRIINIDHTYFFDMLEIVWQNNHQYQVHIMKAMTEQTHFLNTLVKSLMVTNVIGLLFAIISGTYISRRILRPIRDIIATAKEIEVNDLGKRITLTNGNDELQELARTFNHMLNRIQTGFEQQRRFASDASHELRTPITVISGYADMLDRWGKQDQAVLDEGLEAIKSEATNMYSLIEKLLFLARADQNTQTVNRKRVTMEGLIEEIGQETQLIAPNHHIKIYQNDQAIIYADLASIKQMLRIFIENSIKYTPSGGTIGIASRRMDQYLEITIEDTGIGIPEEDQSKIFDRFYRVDRSRSKVTGGTGLGLSIARWIARQHDSMIHLTSTYGQGTIITVRIPLATSQETNN